MECLYQVNKVSGHILSILSLSTIFIFDFGNVWALSPPGAGVWYCLFVIVFSLFHIDYDCQFYFLWKFMCPENTIDLLQIPNVSYQEHCSTCGNRTIIWLVMPKNVYTVSINRCNPSFNTIATIMAPNSNNKYDTNIYSRDCR